MNGMYYNIIVAQQLIIRLTSIFTKFRNKKAKGFIPSILQKKKKHSSRISYIILLCLDIQK